MTDAQEGVQASDRPETKFLSVLKRFVSLKLLVSSIVLVASGLLLVILSFGRTNASVSFFLLQEIGKAILITAAVNGGVKWYLTRQSVELEKAKTEIVNRQLFSSLDTLRGEVLSQTQRMSASASSLVALQAADVSKFYGSRNEASIDIRQAITSEGVTAIKIIGISLNDFIRDEQHELHKAWRTIAKYITSGTPPQGAKELDIQLLLIDPTSSGARWRSEAEGTEEDLSRLHADVQAAITNLASLQKSAKSSAVRLSVRLYRTPPILNLIWTPSISFAQQYHFRPSHSGMNIPVLRYHERQRLENEDRSLHEELRFHFERLWDKCSISLDDYIGGFSRGIELGVYEAGIVNIFYDQALTRNRILHLISASKYRLWIKGISLRSFFQYGDLFDALVKAVIRGVEVRVLLIDPDREQAKMRSFRELRMARGDADWDSFTEEELRQQRLYRETTESIAHISRFIGELRQLPPNPAHGSFEARLFASSPEAFVMLTDSAALVEQYHYGKIKPAEGDSMGGILGGDVPVLEYGRQTPGKNPLKAPYRIFEDHFRFVFEFSKGLDVA
jgi:hypothetical protein